MKKLLKEFKEFALKGNILDLAVAVIIGAAFGAIIKSLVDDMIMPIIGMILGGKGVNELSIVVGTATLRYGNFIQTIINFLIIAFSLFIIVKVFNAAKGRLDRKNAEDAAKEEVPVDETKVLLTEIRDLLKEQNQR